MRRVALAVVAEGAAGAVGGEAVELDDDTLDGPEAVDFVALVAQVDLEVEAWTGQAMVVEERQEDVLEGTAGSPARVGGLFGEGGANGGSSAVAWVALEEGWDREPMAQLAEFEVAEGDLNGVDIGGRGEVEDGARGRRHRDAVEDRALVVWESGEVATDGAARVVPAGRGDVDQFAAASDLP